MDPRAGNKGIFQNLEEIVMALQTKNLEALKRQIHERYDSMKEGWKKQLDPSGQGIVQYLRESLQRP